MDQINKLEDLKNMASSLIKQFKYKQAIDIANEILAIAEDSCEGFHVKALCYMQLEQYDKAKMMVEKIISINGEYLGAYMVLAHVYKRCDQIAEEVEVLQHISLFLEQQQAFSIQELRIYSETCSLLGSAYTLLGEIEQARRYFLLASKNEQNPAQKIIEYSNYLFASNYAIDIENKEMLVQHGKYNDFFNDVKRYEHHQSSLNSKIQVGYISPDFRKHAVVFFSYALLTGFTKNAFEVTCYASGKEDGLTAELKQSVTRWRDISALTADEAARLIYEDKIDILVDLAGHTANNNLPVLARKPAPVQISGIGYFNTTGLKEIDYFLTDVYCDPIGKNDAYFSERLLRLPHSHFCYTALARMPDCALAPCLKNSYVTFGCFNNFSKVTEKTLQLWSQILQQVPSAKLILKSKLFGSALGRQMAIERLRKVGVAADRVDLRPLTKQYLHEYHDVDIALDTYPYPGGATTCEALYMGVPVISLTGCRHGARFGYSLLKNVGLEELVAETEAEYIEKAIRLAADRDLLQIMRKNLRQMMQKSSLMDSKQYLSEVETVYREIWLKKQKKYYSGVDASLLQEKLAQGDFAAMISPLKEMLLHNPDDGELLSKLAGAYIESGRREDAEFVVEKLLRLYPENEFFCFLQARVQYMNGNLPLVIDTLEKAAKDRSLVEDEVNSLVYNLLANSYGLLGNCEKSTEYYWKASRCSIGETDKAIDYSNYLFHLNYLPQLAQRELYAAHRGYEDIFRGVRQYGHDREKRQGRVRIGYISADFREHVVTFFSYALFAAYNKDKFTVICFSRGKEDALSKQIQSLTDGWISIKGMDADRAAQIIYEQKIDILVDLSGHTKNNCLPIMARKTAPIQICGIGYFNTTGLSCVDYFLTDICCDPVGENDEYFSEKLIRLPHSHFCYTSLREDIEIAEIPCLENGYITFGSFNNFTKVNDEVLLVWRQILLQLPNAKLILKSSVLGNAYALTAIKERFRKLEMPLSRIIFRGESYPYLHEYSDIDIALDTFPYPGGGTTCDALYMGVPVVTLRGLRHGARFGYSILKNIGLEELAAHSKDEYVNKAIALAGDAVLLNGLRRNLRAIMQNSGLMDARQYMDDIETAYAEVYHQYESQ